MNRFWWQSGSLDRKGINWVSWNGLSMSKCHGGLTFRSLYGYNIAPMAKHIWKFVYKSRSLVSRFFNAKYFQNSHVLQAKALSGSSFIWQGIVTAKNEVLQGYRWVLGDGESIKCTQDLWLQGKSDFKVDQSRGYVDNSMVVSQLFLQNERGWDAVKVMQLFSREDADIIWQLVYLNIRVTIIWLGLKLQMGSIQLKRVIKCGMIVMWASVLFCSQKDGADCGNWICLIKSRFFFGVSAETTSLLKVD